MVDPNSRLAYHTLAASGVLADQEARALEEVMLRGPGTNREIDKRIGHNGRSWHPSLHRLERKGLLHTPTKRKCSVSGHVAKVYAWTGATTPKPLLPVHRFDKKGAAKSLHEFMKRAHTAGVHPGESIYDLLDWLEG